MAKLIGVLRLISLSILFGGSSAVVFVAVTLVKAAVANGMTTGEAAAVNAPAFIAYAAIAAGAALVLLLAEAVDLSMVKRGLKNASRLVRGRYLASILCVLATFVFSFAIVPAMKELHPQMKEDAVKAAEFKRLHEISRSVFGTAILFALAALVLQGMESGAVIRKES